jgi:protein-L-isoaspartate(D-aspartate) O-methyltransferase
VSFAREDWHAFDDATSATERKNMVTRQLEARAIRDARVLEAMRTVPRHLFLSHDVARNAYEDRPLPTAYGQTISQPYMVALMLELLACAGNERVLEIGTGSGYQTALLALLADRVCSIERHAALLDGANDRLSKLGLTNVRTLCGDGSEGWAENAPYDRIVLAAATPSISSALTSQLAEAGIFVGPVGERSSQELLVVTRKKGVLETAYHGGCVFVPLVGRGGFPPLDD